MAAEVESLCYHEKWEYDLWTSQKQREVLMPDRNEFINIYLQPQDKQLTHTHTNNAIEIKVIDTLWPNS